MFLSCFVSPNFCHTLVSRYHVDSPLVMRLLSNINENHSYVWSNKIVLSNVTHWNHIIVQPATVKSVNDTTVSSSMVQTPSAEDENVTKTSNATSALPLCPDDITMNLSK